jgi:hypothetical protein
MFPIKNGLKKGSVLSPLLLNFDLYYAIRRVRVNQEDVSVKYETPSSSLFL